MESQRLQQLFSFLEKSPNEPFVLFAIAKEYEGQDQLEKALEYYQKLEEENPDYVGTYYHLAKLYEALEQPQKAWQTYIKGIEIANKANDQHSVSELMAAKLELGDEDDFE